MVALDRPIALGDRVSVPFGRTRVEGTVVDTIGRDVARKFVVSVAIDDDDEMLAAYDEGVLDLSA